MLVAVVPNVLPANVGEERVVDDLLDAMAGANAL